MKMTGFTYKHKMCAWIASLDIPQAIGYWCRSVNINRSKTHHNPSSSTHKNECFFFGHTIEWYCCRNVLFLVIFLLFLSRRMENPNKWPNYQMISLVRLLFFLEIISFCGFDDLNRILSIGYRLCFMWHCKTRSKN